MPHVVFFIQSREETGTCTQGTQVSPGDPTMTLSRCLRGVPHTLVSWRNWKGHCPPRGFFPKMDKGVTESYVPNFPRFLCFISKKTMRKKKTRKKHSRFVVCGMTSYYLCDVLSNLQIERGQKDWCILAQPTRSPVFRVFVCPLDVKICRRPQCCFQLLYDPNSLPCFMVISLWYLDELHWPHSDVTGMMVLIITIIYMENYAQMALLQLLSG